MKCPSCGAEMNLIEVAPSETTMVSGYEEHTFECAACHERARQFVSSREIGRFIGEPMRLPRPGRKAPSQGVTARNVWARFVRAVPPKQIVALAAILAVIAVLGVVRPAQGPQGPTGEQGLPGPKGPAGDSGRLGPAQGIRVVRSACDDASCTAQCNENEMLVTAYCGPKRNPAVTPTERTASCRNPVPANSPLVVVCARMESP